MVEQINATQYEAVIQKDSCLVVLGASWCPDCRKIEPILEELSKEYKDKTHIYHISIDKESALKDALGVRRIPTLIGYKNGQEIERLIEPDSKQKIQTLLNQVL